MPQAARVADMTSHGPPLNPGPGCPTVVIGSMPSWRALPASVGGAVESVSNSVKQFMQKPVHTPPSATPDIAKIVSGLVQAAGKAAAEKNPAGLGAAAGASAALIATNVGLTAAWTAASPVPGGQPAANTAYTEGIKAAMAGAASAVFSAIGSMTDMHICPIPCPIPPHGPGMVTKGSGSVLIGNLPAARKDDKVFEACGGDDPIAMGCPTVEIGDSGGGSGGGGGGGGGATTGTAAGAAGGVSAVRQDKATEGGAIAPTSIVSLPVTCECANPACAEAFRGAAQEGTALVDRETYGCQGPPVEVVDTGTHWVEIELVGEDDVGIPGEPFIVKLANGEEVRGKLGPDGRFRIEGLTESDPCSISFPRLDRDAWENA